jgi:hypothetical protein
VKRQALVEGVALIALIIAGVLLRIYFQDLPNFAPVAALALFAGYYFRSWAMAVCVPLGVMVVSDAFIGAYDWRMMAVVYGMLALPVALRSPLRRYLDVSQNGLRRALGAVAGLVACSLCASLAFFFVTNFGSWLWYDMYEHTWAGLMVCYTQAIPFFRYTLTGDLLFAFSLFGGYCVALQTGLAQPRVTVASSV